MHDFHENNGAKFVPFAGYNMPINYSDGIIKEHLHVRKSVGLFDVSHMGQIIIPFENININNLQKIIPLNFNNLHLNKSYYTFILNNKGGIIDDIILSFIELKNDKYIFIVFNASRKKIDEEIFLRACSNSKLFNNHSLIALQGPLSYKIIVDTSKRNNNIVKSCLNMRLSNRINFYVFLFTLITFRHNSFVFSYLLFLVSNCFLSTFSSS